MASRRPGLAQSIVSSDISNCDEQWIRTLTTRAWCSNGKGRLRGRSNGLQNGLARRPIVLGKRPYSPEVVEAERGISQKTPSHLAKAGWTQDRPSACYRIDTSSLFTAWDPCASKQWTSSSCISSRKGYSEQLARRFGYDNDTSIIARSTIHAVSARASGCGTISGAERPAFILPSHLAMALWLPGCVWDDTLIQHRSPS